MRWARFLLGLSLLLPLSGCATLTALLREELALETETLDRVGQISTDAGAREYLRTFEREAKDRQENLKKMREVVEGDLGKGAKALWDLYMKSVLDPLLNRPINDETLQIIDELGRQRDRLRAQLKKNVDEQPNQKIDFAKEMAFLPTDDFMIYYVREKMALQVARQREINRLGGIVKSSNVATPELKRLLETLKTKKS